MVFVLDKHKQPLMPCTPKRARLLLAQRRAVVVRVKPFVIRLKDRLVEDSILQPLALKLDPGSNTTGITLARVEQSAEGDIHHAVLLAEVQHRGAQVHEHKVTQKQARRRRRSANLRYRAPRFLNRRIPKGWLPPSLRSRINNCLTWTRRFSRWSPITRIEVEQVRFDMQLLQNPEITGVAYQRGELAGWELRNYLLVKYGYQCAYCQKTGVPFELDHQIPRSRGGSNRASNLVLACHECNQAKGNQNATEFGHPEVAERARVPLKDAAAVNASRFQLVEALRGFGLPLATWSGGRTRWNRARFGLSKTHALDALAVGELAGVRVGKLTTLRISATGRGQHCRTLWTKHGFPRGYLMRQKMVAGFASGDRVSADVPAPYAAQGSHVGRVTVRKNAFFAIQTAQGKVDSVPARFCRLVQRADGYDFLLAPAIQGSEQRSTPAPAPKKEGLLPPLDQSRGSLQAEHDEMGLFLTNPAIDGYKSWLFGLYSADTYHLLIA